MLAFLKKDKKEEKTVKKDSKDTKAEPKQDEATNQVPDELPTLTQDVLNEAIPDETTEESDDIPDELPSLDLNGDIISEPKSEPEPAKVEVVEENSSVPAELEPLESEVKPVSQPAPAQPLKPLSEEGYFVDIEDRLKHGENPQNILGGMKEHWKKEHKMEEELKTTTQTELEGGIRELTLELQDLESKWVEYSHNIERTKNVILSIEAEISIKAEELKILLEKLDKVEEIYKKVKEHHA